MAAGKTGHRFSVAYVVTRNDDGTLCVEVDTFSPYVASFVDGHIQDVDFTDPDVLSLFDTFARWLLAMPTQYTVTPSPDDRGVSERLWVRPERRSRPR